MTYYDDKTRRFSRDDYSQKRSHGGLAIIGNDCEPHQHRFDDNDRGFGIV